ncbi:hypothetical protein SKAU_G00399270 [Synaphobranchus kaupii]|uniref:Acyl-coenzyme A thioesterase 13 n=1 Tax=Synaphobranchus kaupii TaxID=118154 RepID=A0A9Q1IA77_SYNKA|nr:hypothetical protein SKAU_G00399270 [Synaphobranchus kaupii]
MSSISLNELKQVLRAMVDSPRFDRVLSKVNIVSASPGKIVCEMKVEEEHTNRGGTLHGGLTATLVDIVSSAALTYTERGSPGVSVDMNITYMNAAKLGEDVLITAQVLKQGRTLAFATRYLTAYHSSCVLKMTSNGKMKRTDVASENIMSFLTGTTKGGLSERRTLQVLQPSAVNGNLGRVREMGKTVLKRKLWGAEQAKGSKRIKAEVAVLNEDVENENQSEGMTKQAYELLVKETPPSTYWKEVAEERRKALYNVLQENEKLHKAIEAKDEEISKLQSENEELQELAEHVKHMADMIERLTGKSPDSLENVQELSFQGEEEETGEDEFSSGERDDLEWGEEDEDSEEEEEDDDDGGEDVFGSGEEDDSEWGEEDEDDKDGDEHQ